MCCRIVNPGTDTELQSHGLLPAGFGTRAAKPVLQPSTIQQTFTWLGTQMAVK